MRKVLFETTIINACKLSMICINQLSQQQNGEKFEKRCVLVRKISVLFYLIIVSKERNQGRFELFSKINAILGVSLRQSVYDIKRKVQFMYNLCMNHAALDCESLDPVS